MLSTAEMFMVKTLLKKSTEMPTAIDDSTRLKPSELAL
jgi:hypothetical protein